MNRIRPRKRVLILLILGTALLLWIYRQQGLAEIRRETRETHTQLISLREHRAAAVEALARAKQELSAEQNARDTALAALTQELKALARIDPESRWSAPPMVLPEWNAESPYVWIRKEMVPKLGGKAFGEDGTLGPEAAYVLAIDAPVMEALNGRLKQTLADYRELERTEARRTDEHLPGLASQSGDKITVTIKPLPEQGARYRLEFEATLRELVGEQRAGLITAVGEPWLSNAFSESGTQPKTISIIRHTHGSYTIAIKSGGNWFSMGGTWKDVERHVPPQVRPLFIGFPQTTGSGQ